MISERRLAIARADQQRAKGHRYHSTTSQQAILRRGASHRHSNGRVVVPHYVIKTRFFVPFWGHMEKFVLSLSKEVHSVLQDKVHAEIEIQDDVSHEDQEPSGGQESNLSKIETITVTWEFRRPGVQLPANRAQDAAFYELPLKYLIMMQQKGEAHGLRMFFQDKRLTEIVSLESGSNLDRASLEIRNHGPQGYSSDEWVFRPCLRDCE